MRQPVIIADQPALEAHCRAWRAAGIFAFDTEFIRDDTYDAALCLVQVSSGGEVVLVDSAAGLDLSCFWELVTDPAVVTIVHAGKEDFEVCLRMRGRVPRAVSRSCHGIAADAGERSGPGGRGGRAIVAARA